MENSVGDLISREAAVKLLREKAHYWFDPAAKTALMEAACEVKNMLGGDILVKEPRVELSVKHQVNVLGIAYMLEYANEGDDPQLKGKDGYVDTSEKRCVVDEMRDMPADGKWNIQEYRRSVARHELIHAFLYESGLDNCSWACNEEMVDWLAIQFPKMAMEFSRLGVM